MLKRALEAEAGAYLSSFADAKDKNGRRAAVPNGHAPERTILTGVESLEIRRPRVIERKAVANGSERRRFISGI
jgi:hypothetical protein